MRAKCFRAIAANLFILAIVGAILNTSLTKVSAQPTYKLDVKPHLKPLATLKLEGARVSRSELTDDPGFRLQFHIKQADGKSVSTSDARLASSIELTTQTPGTFSIVLELFYPAYKGGTSQKGEFKPVSDVLNYKVESGKVVVLPKPPPPAPAPKSGAKAVEPGPKK